MDRTFREARRPQLLALGLGSKRANTSPVDKESYLLPGPLGDCCSMTSLYERSQSIVRQQLFMRSSISQFREALQKIPKSMAKDLLTGIKLTALYLEIFEDIHPVLHSLTLGQFNM
jgi:hypothetical protein